MSKKEQIALAYAMIDLGRGVNSPEINRDTVAEILTNLCFAFPDVFGRVMRHLEKSNEDHNRQGSYLFAVQDQIASEALAPQAEKEDQVADQPNAIVGVAGN